jgi:cell division protein FtsB
MTKDEIKKGLEFCKADWCVMCPYCNCIGCEGFLKQDALTLITKQEQEIARLKAELKQLKTNAGILARGVRDLNHENYELTEKIKQAKIEAVKEFAEKLWNKIKDNGIDYKIGLRALGEEIDELLKEYE